MNGITGTIRCDSIRESGSIHWIKSLPFLGIHLACLAAFWTGVTWKALVLCLASYVIRMFGITAGYHRYFSHRSYRTSRLFQFVLAWIGCSALQRGPLWWAAHHRYHHQHSDQQEDLHSPKQRGFWWAHIGWILCDRYDATPFEAIKDFSKYPELRWLNCYSALPGVLLGIGCLLAVGWQGLVWGFFISTAPVSRDVPRQFPLPYGWDCSVQDHRYEPKQRPAGSDHHGRRMAQQSPSLLYICQDGFLLVGSRHLLLRPELAFPLRYCLGHEEAEPTSFGNCKNLKHTLQPVSLSNVPDRYRD